MALTAKQLQVGGAESFRRRLGGGVDKWQHSLMSEENRHLQIMSMIASLTG